MEDEPKEGGQEKVQEAESQTASSQEAEEKSSSS